MKIVNFPSSLFISFQSHNDFNVNRLHNKSVFKDLLIDCINEYKLLCILIHISESQSFALKVLHQGVSQYITK